MFSALFISHLQVAHRHISSELATQIHSIFSLFLSSQPCPEGEEDEEEPASPTYPPALLLVSGKETTPSQDLSRFLSTGADIVVGTPGRVEEFLLGKGVNVVSVKELEILVLDEADRYIHLFPSYHVVVQPFLFTDS